MGNIRGCISRYDSIFDRATGERIRADACDAVRDCYARKARTAFECTQTDARDAVGYCYAFKARATRERPIGDACDTIRDNKVRN